MADDTQEMLMDAWEKIKFTILLCALFASMVMFVTALAGVVVLVLE